MSRHPVVQASLLWVGTRIGFLVVTYFTVVLASQYATRGFRREWLLDGGVNNLRAFLGAWSQ